MLKIPLVDKFTLYLQYIRGKYWEYEYEEVVTPNIYNFELWKTSGHADHYKQNMFHFEIEKQEFGLKPMNCPGRGLSDYLPVCPTCDMSHSPAAWISSMKECTYAIRAITSYCLHSAGIDQKESVPLAGYHAGQQGL